MLQRRTAWLRYVVPVIALMVVVIAMPVWADPAPASTATTTTEAPASKISEVCKQYVGLTNRMAGCIRHTIDASAEKFFGTFYGKLQNLIAVVMTLAVIIYGVMLAYGMVERVGRDTMILLFKISAVVAFCSNSPLLYDMATRGMDGAAEAAISYVPINGPADNVGTDFSHSTCMRTMTEQQELPDGSGQPVKGPWLGIDCLLDTVIGIRVATKPGEKVTSSTLVWYNKQFDATTAGQPEQVGMSRALVYLFFSGIVSSVFGLLLAVTGFFFIAGLLMVIVKAFFTYIAGYIGVALLIIVSPLFIPLVLFTSVTKQYFDKWLKLVISFALQPVIMLVFITFSLAAMDLAAFSGKYSIMYRIAGEASQAQGFNLNEYLTATRTQDGARTPQVDPADKNIKGIVEKKPRVLAQKKGDVQTPLPVINRTDGGVFKGMAEVASCNQQLSASGTQDAVKKACEAVQPIMVKLESIDWKRMAAARASEGHVPVDLSDESTDAGQQIAREVFASVLFCAIVVFILNGLLAVVPLVAHDLLGDAGQSPDIATAMGKQMGGVSGMMGGLATQLRGAFK